MINRNFISSLHNSTNRKYLSRMVDDKVSCMKEARNMKRIIGMVIADMAMEVINIYLVVGLKLQRNLYIHINLRTVQKY